MSKTIKKGDRVRFGVKSPDTSKPGELVIGEVIETTISKSVVIFLNPWTMTRSQITIPNADLKLLDFKYCNDGQVCKHLEFNKGTRGNTDHLVCKKYHRVVMGKNLKQRLLICQDKGDFEAKPIKGDLFSL